MNSPHKITKFKKMVLIQELKMATRNNNNNTNRTFLILEWKRIIFIMKTRKKFNIIHSNNSSNINKSTSNPHKSKFLIYHMINSSSIKIQIPIYIKTKTKIKATVINTNQISIHNNQPNTLMKSIVPNNLD